MSLLQYDNFADVKDSNDSFFLSDQKYTADLEFVRKNADWIEGWRVGEISE